MVLGPALATLLWGQVRAGEVELRGTLLCRPEGDPSRERPAHRCFLVVEPVGHPVGSEIVGEAGIFRVRVPKHWIDRQVFLKIRRGYDQVVDVFPVFLEVGRARRTGEKYVYSLGAYPLPVECESLACDIDLAMQVREWLQHGPTDSTRRAVEVSPARRALAIPAAFLASGFIFRGSPDDAPLPSPPDSVISISAESLDVRVESIRSVQPGDWLAYARLASSPYLGRVVTSLRGPDEAVFWNPSAVLRTVGSGFTLGGGMRREMRGAAWFHLSGEDDPTLVPRLATLGMLGYFGGQDVELVLEDGRRVDVDLTHVELVLIGGLAFALSERASLGMSLRNFRQRVDQIEFFRRTVTVDAEGDTSTVEALVTHRARTNNLDADLSLSIDVSSRVRVGAAVYGVGNSKALGPRGEAVALREGVLGALWHRGRVQLGGQCELGGGHVEVSSGISIRATNTIGIDIGAGSRFQAAAAGFDFSAGGVTARVRVRRDRFQDSALLGTFTVLL